MSYNVYIFRSKFPSTTPCIILTSRACCLLIMKFSTIVSFLVLMQVQRQSMSQSLLFFTIPFLLCFLCFVLTAKHKLSCKTIPMEKPTIYSGQISSREYFVKLCNIDGWRFYQQGSSCLSAFWFGSLLIENLFLSSTQIYFAKHPSILGVIPS